MVKMAVTRGLQSSPFQETVTGNGLKSLFPVFAERHLAFLAWIKAIKGQLFRNDSPVQNAAGQGHLGPLGFLSFICSLNALVNALQSGSGIWFVDPFASLFPEFFTAQLFACAGVLGTLQES